MPDTSLSRPFIPPFDTIYNSAHMGLCQEGEVRAPGDRYQEVEAILTQGGAPRTDALRQHVPQEEHCLQLNWLIGKQAQ